MNSQHDSSFRPFRRVLAVGLACFSLFLGLFAAGCASAPGGGASTAVQTFGPLVAEVAQTRIAVAILERNPGRESALLAVAATLEAITSDAAAGDISEAVVRAFVAKYAAQWGLLPGEGELLVQGLLAARATYLSSTGAVAVQLADPRVRAWLGAIQRGIRSGVAVHQARKAAVGRPSAPGTEGPRLAILDGRTLPERAEHIALNLTIDRKYAFAVEASEDLRVWRTLFIQPKGTGDASILLGREALPAARCAFRVRYWEAITPGEFLGLTEPVRFVAAEPQS